MLKNYRTDIKYILGTLFLLQVLLIGIYYICQQGFYVEHGGNTITPTNKHDESPVTFIKNVNNKKQNSGKNENFNSIVTNNFNNDFVIFTESGYNNKTNLTCFREGTYFSLPLDKNVQKCTCQPEWHGKDCGQPEIIWRALMTSKVPLATRSNAKKLPNKIIYMITGAFLSLEIIEIQISELENIVDFFILCQQFQYNEKTSNKLRDYLKLKFNRELFDRLMIFNNCNNLYHKNSTRTKKSLRSVYKEFKDNIQAKFKIQIISSDIFIFSLDDEILNRNAIKYFVYYNDLPQHRNVIRFRLKYNVYGFYWQHPESTYLGSALCTIQQLETNFHSDPERLFAKRKPLVIIGDLNYIGGWYCRYCYQPNEIVQKLIIESRNDAKSIVNFPKTSNYGRIDVSYIQNLIANGLFIDGKLGLNKLNRFRDKYYAPGYAEQNAWKFDNILTNLFISFNNANDDDYTFN